MTIMTPEEINGQLDRIMDFMAPAFASSAGEATVDGWMSRLMTGQEKLIGCYNEGVLVGGIGIAASQFESGKKVMFLTFVGGKGMSLFLYDSIEFLKEIAKDLGCGHIWTTGREGWGRVIPGMRKISTVHELEI